MPPIKLSKISFPPPRPRPVPGAPTAPPPAPPAGDAPTLPGVDPTPGTGVDSPVDSAPVEPTGTGTVGEASADRAFPQRGSGGAAVDVDVPSELVDRVWRAVETVPGLTIATALTLALQQFLASLPDDYEREGS